MAGKRRVFLLVLRHDGERWHGRIRDNPAGESTVDSRESVVRELGGAPIGLP